MADDPEPFTGKGPGKPSPPVDVPNPLPAGGDVSKDPNWGPWGKGQVDVYYHVWFPAQPFDPPPGVVIRITITLGPIETFAVSGKTPSDWDKDGDTKVEVSAHPLIAKGTMDFTRYIRKYPEVTLQDYQSVSVKLEAIFPNGSIGTHTFEYSRKVGPERKKKKFRAYRWRLTSMSKGVAFGLFEGLEVEAGKSIYINDPPDDDPPEGDPSDFDPKHYKPFGEPKLYKPKQFFSLSDSLPPAGDISTASEASATLFGQVTNGPSEITPQLASLIAARLPFEVSEMPPSESSGWTSLDEIPGGEINPISEGSKVRESARGPMSGEIAKGGGGGAVPEVVSFALVECNPKVLSIPDGVADPSGGTLRFCYKFQWDRGATNEIEITWTKRDGSTVTETVNGTTNKETSCQCDKDVGSVSLHAKTGDAQVKRLLC